MNRTAGALVCGVILACAVWSLIRALRREPPRWPDTATALIIVAALSWLATGFFAWVRHTAEPARPEVFTGYALTAAALVAVGVPASARAGGRLADVARFAVLLLAAFTCWRAEQVWLFTRT
ncbi:hypothetical protein [Gordonia sp. FQ]|uniref:hypothetical protein n=1 Tax=Gordonia sp. FQ TaxID=3446634 RepID=UPI003F867FE6